MATTSAPTTSAPATSTTPARPWWQGAVAGLTAGAVTVAVAELLAAALVRSSREGGTPSPVVAVGAAFVDRTPPWLKDLAIALFGTHDKLVLLLGIAVVLSVLAALAGVLAVRHRRAGLLAVVLLAAVAALAVLERPGASALDVVPTLVGALVGLLALTSSLTRLDHADRTTRTTGPRSPRRAFLRHAGLLAATAAVAGVASQVVSRANDVARASRAAVRLPRPTGPSATAAQRADLDVVGLSPMLTPAEQFYRIDTALAVPQVDAGSWRLRVRGMVENEIEIDFAELLALPMIEPMVTLTCVSNEVGGDLIGNQIWLGHPVRELLARAAPLADADMVLSRSADGWTAGTPLEALTDPGRDAVLAVAMDGVPLPVEHGFPARMVVPGLYGYVSATKWVVELEVTRFDRAEGYWTPRGWSALGPIKTASRIDVPRGGSVAAGRVAVAGVAWAQHRGIQAVEVRVDEGSWQQADLGGGGTTDSWRQWVWQWDATPGDHTLQVRATDAGGQAQPAEQAPPAPDGATGWHTVQVSVSG